MNSIKRLILGKTNPLSYFPSDNNVNSDSDTDTDSCSSDTKFEKAFLKKNLPEIRKVDSRKMNRYLGFVPQPARVNNNNNSEKPKYQCNNNNNRIQQQPQSPQKQEYSLIGTRRMSKSLENLPSPNTTRVRRRSNSFGKTSTSNTYEQNVNDLKKLFMIKDPPGVP
jgi:hypothetical protein